jgi:branched-chain amino acid transport system ATP-binding protein
MGRDASTGPTLVFIKYSICNFQFSAAGGSGLGRMMEFLHVDQVYKHFGGIPALHGVSLKVEQGKIHGVIGPNGAGKTTMFNVINGVYNPDEGRVIFKDREITGLKPNRIAARGIGRTFQVARVFNEMTLMENMMVPLIPKRVSKKEGEKRASELLEMAGLTRLKDQLAVGIHANDDGRSGGNFAGRTFCRGESRIN